MKINVIETKDVFFIRARCGVRYWEDGKINGIDDEAGVMPCRKGENWEPTINLESGLVMDWPQGQVADIHYKVCDAGVYELLDDNMQVVTAKEGYVPRIMCPEDNGYGDYVIMKIGPDGKINKWKPNLDDFVSES